MKCVPIFFLVGFSVLHLIYVIAAPNAKRNEIEKLKVKRAAAISRFNLSKRNAPFKSPWKKRYALVTHLTKYAKYLKAVTKRHLRSVKSRLMTQISGYRGAFLRTLGSDLAALRSYKGPFAQRYGQKQSTASKPEMKEEYETLSKTITQREGDKDSTRSIMQFTASACENFRQVAQEMLLRIQGHGATLDGDKAFNYLKASDLPLVRTSHTLQETVLKQAERDDLTSKTFVPVPSGVPSLEPRPGIYPEPSPRKSNTEIFADRDLEPSRAPELSGFPMHGMATIPGSVLTFRRLARFAARI